MVEEIHNPHDKGYKILLASEKIFLELLQSFVGLGWVDEIDPHSMTRIDKTFILQDFNEKEADLVYRLKLKDQDVIFYLLMELQSTVDFQMPYRLLLYMVEIWRDILKNTGLQEATRKEFRLPAIVPLVLYNGESKWTAGRSFKNSLSAAELFEEYIVDFKYILIDVNRYEKGTLIELSNLIGVVFLLDQAISPQEYRRRFLEIGAILRKLDSQTFRLFATWFKNIAVVGLPDRDKDEVIRILNETDLEEVEQMISNMEQTFKKMVEEAKYEGLITGEAKGKAEGKAEGKVEGKLEGKAEGKLEGRAEGLYMVVQNMLAKNTPETFIAEVTGMPVEEIRRIKKETIDN